MIAMARTAALLLGVLLSLAWGLEIYKGAPRGGLLSSAWVIAMVVAFIAAFCLFDFALSR